MTLTVEEKQKIYEALLFKMRDGKLVYGSIKEVAVAFDVSRRTVQIIWVHFHNLSTHSIGKVGRKRVQIDVNKVLEIPLRLRTNIRTMACAMGMKKSTLHRRVKEGALRAHTNAIKPYLTDENKKARLKFCLSKIQPGTINNHSMFIGMYNYIHVDEKWFYMTKTMEKYYLHPQEVEPLRSCKSKKFITKIMFLAAVARPRFDENGDVTFNGKIGIFPFVYQENAKRKSKNRAAGTLETKPISSITKDIYRSCLIEKVLPAIGERWPTSQSSEPIYIQQDNAKPHISVDDVKFVEAAKKYGLDIRLTCQPPNSPDMNVLDLGFFRAIQSLQHQEAPTTIDELIAAVEKSFRELSSKSLHHVFLSLQMCMVEVMKTFGSHNYKVPHMNKNGLQNEGNITSRIEFSSDVVEAVIRHLQN